MLAYALSMTLSAVARRGWLALSSRDASSSGRGVPHISHAASLRPLWYEHSLQLQMSSYVSMLTVGAQVHANGKKVRERGGWRAMVRGYTRWNNPTPASPVSGHPCGRLQVPSFLV